MRDVTGTILSVHSPVTYLACPSCSKKASTCFAEQHSSAHCPKCGEISKTEARWCLRLQIQADAPVPLSVVAFDAASHLFSSTCTAARFWEHSKCLPRTAVVGAINQALVHKHVTMNLTQQAPGKQHAPASTFPQQQFVATRLVPGDECRVDLIGVLRETTVGPSPMLARERMASASARGAMATANASPGGAAQLEVDHAAALHHNHNYSHHHHHHHHHNHSRSHTHLMEQSLLLNHQGLSGPTNPPDFSVLGPNSPAFSVLSSCQPSVLLPAGISGLAFRTPGPGSLATNRHSLPSPHASAYRTARPLHLHPQMKQQQQRQQVVGGDHTPLPNAKRRSHRLSPNDKAAPASEAVPAPKRSSEHTQLPAAHQAPQEHAVAARAPQVDMVQTVTAASRHSVLQDTRSEENQQHGRSKEGESKRSVAGATCAVHNKAESLTITQTASQLGKDRHQAAPAADEGLVESHADTTQGSEGKHQQHQQQQQQQQQQSSAKAMGSRSSGSPDSGHGSTHGVSYGDDTNHACAVAHSQAVSPWRMDHPPTTTIVAVAATAATTSANNTVTSMKDPFSQAVHSEESKAVQSKQTSLSQEHKEPHSLCTKRPKRGTSNSQEQPAAISQHKCEGEEDHVRVRSAERSVGADGAAVVEMNAPAQTPNLVESTSTSQPCSQESQSSVSDRLLAQAAAAASAKDSPLSLVSVQHTRLNELRSALSEAHRIVREADIETPPSQDTPIPGDNSTQSCDAPISAEEGASQPRAGGGGSEQAPSTPTADHTCSAGASSSQTQAPCGETTPTSQALHGTTQLQQEHSAQARRGRGAASAQHTPNDAAAVASTAAAVPSSFVTPSARSNNSGGRSGASSTQPPRTRCTVGSTPSLFSPDDNDPPFHTPATRTQADYAATPLSGLKARGESDPPYNHYGGAAVPAGGASAHTGPSPANEGRSVTAAAHRPRRLRAQPAPPFRGLLEIAPGRGRQEEGAHHDATDAKNNNNNNNNKTSNGGSGPSGSRETARSGSSHHYHQQQQQQQQLVVKEDQSAPIQEGQQAAAVGPQEHQQAAANITQQQGERQPQHASHFESGNAGGGHGGGSQERAPPPAPGSTRALVHALNCLVDRVDEIPDDKEAACVTLEWLGGEESARHVRHLLRTALSHISLALSTQTQTHRMAAFSPSRSTQPVRHAPATLPREHHRQRGPHRQQSLRWTHAYSRASPTLFTEPLTPPSIRASPQRRVHADAHPTSPLQERMGLPPFELHDVSTSTQLLDDHSTLDLGTAESDLTHASFGRQADTGPRHLLGSWDLPNAGCNDLGDSSTTMDALGLLEAPDQVRDPALEALLQQSGDAGPPLSGVDAVADCNPWLCHNDADVTNTDMTTLSIDSVSEFNTQAVSSSFRPSSSWSQPNGFQNHSTAHGRVGQRQDTDHSHAHGFDDADGEGGIHSAFCFRGVPQGDDGKGTRQDEASVEGDNEGRKRTPGKARDPSPGASQAAGGDDEQQVRAVRRSPRCGKGARLQRLLHPDYTTGGHTRRRSAGKARSPRKRNNKGKGCSSNSRRRSGNGNRRRSGSRAASKRSSIEGKAHGADTPRSGHSKGGGKGKQMALHRALHTKNGRGHLKKQNHSNRQGDHQDGDDDDEYEVETIRSFRLFSLDDTDRPGLFYEVKWKGYPEEENTFEREDNIKHLLSPHTRRDAHELLAAAMEEWEQKQVVQTQS